MRPNEQPQKNNGSGPRLFGALVVNADPADQETLKDLLGACGVEADFLSTLNETIERLEEGRAGILVCNANLPDGTFRDIISAISERGLDLPVIVCSDFYDRDLYIEAMSLGAFDYLSFPYRREEVTWVVNNAVNWSTHYHMVN
jgi:DNA-binding NtrC family response regulator